MIICEAMMKTPKQINDELARAGITKTEYARKLGLDYHTVVQLLAGTIAGNFGKGHNAAVAMGLKDGTIRDEAKND
jgi:gp16 family phage-associated protein